MCNCKNGICVCWANYEDKDLNFDCDKAIDEALKSIDEVKECGNAVFALQRLFEFFTPEEGKIVIQQLEEKYSFLK